jgi:hypothetical protein
MRYALFDRDLLIGESYPDFFPVLSTLALFGPEAQHAIHLNLYISFLIISINEASPKYTYLKKICCSCSQDILYHNVQIERPSDSQVYHTLSQSTHLASRTRSSETTD